MKKLVVFIILNLIFIQGLDATEKIEVKFSDCVDGDTIKVLIDGEKTTVRLLAIDTPETVHPTKEVEAYGKEASNLTCDMIKNAKKIIIEYDDESTKTDKYSRHLAWVYADDKMIQKELIKKGYAKVDYLYGDYKYTKELQEIEKKSKENKVGIWSSEEYIFENEEITENSNTNKTDSKEENKSFTEKIFDFISDSISKLFDSIVKEIEKGLKSIFN